MLKRVKQNALHTLKTSGVFEAFKNSRWRRERLLILAYHGVAIKDEHLWNPDLYFSESELRARFKILKSGDYNVLPLAEALERLAANDLPPRAVVLTFDDGNHDFHQQTFPLLQEFGFPATVYLTTYYAEYNKPVFTVACSYILWKGQTAKQFNLKPLVNVDQAFDLSIAAERERAWGLLVTFANEQNFSGVEKNDLLRRLAEFLSVDYQQMLDQRLLHIMSAPEVAAVAAAGIDIQLHTHRHRTPDDAELFSNELEDNRRVVKNYTQVAANHFCYPSGIYKISFLPLLERANVVSATTCEPQLAARTSNRLLLPRLVDTSSLSSIEFEGWLVGVSEFLPQRKRPVAQNR